MSSDDISGILGAAESAFARHDYAAAVGLFKQALYVIGKEKHSQQREIRRADILLRIVDALDMNSNWFDALIYIDSTVVIAQSWNDKHLEIQVNLRAAKILLNRGSWKDAKKRLANVHDIINEPEFMDEKGDWLLLRGQAEMRLGHHGRSMELAKLAIELSEDIVDPVLEGMGLVLQAATRHHLGDLNEALGLFQDAIDTLLAEGKSDYVALAYDGMGGVYGTMGDYKMALLQHGKCVQISKEKGNHRNQAIGLLHSAWCRAKEGELGVAKKELMEARTLLKTRGEIFSVAEIDRVQAVIAFKEKDHASMIARFQNAIKKMAEMETPYQKGVVSLEYGQYMKNIGETAEAKRAFEVAKEAFELIESFYYLEIVLREIAG